MFRKAPFQWATGVSLMCVIVPLIVFGCCLSGCNEPKIFTTSLSVKKSIQDGYYQCTYAVYDSSQLFKMSECWGELDSKEGKTSHVSFNLSDNSAFDELNLNQDWHPDSAGISSMTPVCKIGRPTLCTFTFSTHERDLPDTFSVTIFKGPATTYQLANRMTTLLFKKSKK